MGPRPSPAAAESTSATRDSRTNTNCYNLSWSHPAPRRHKCSPRETLVKNFIAASLPTAGRALERPLRQSGVMDEHEYPLAEPALGSLRSPPSSRAWLALAPTTPTLGSEAARIPAPRPRPKLAPKLDPKLSFRTRTTTAFDTAFTSAFSTAFKTAPESRVTTASEAALTIRPEPASTLTPTIRADSASASAFATSLTTGRGSDSPTHSRGATLSPAECTFHHYYQ